MANVGVDRSHVGHSGVGNPGNGMKIDDEVVDDETAGGEASADEMMPLPRDPDANAAALHRALEARFGCRLAGVVSDSVGRACGATGSRGPRSAQRACPRLSISAAPWTSSARR